MQINLGTVPFLNAAPLVRALEKGDGGGFNVMRFEPSVLSEKLADGAVDVGLVPSVELLRSDGLAAMPGISISSFGKVDSVVLVSKREITDVRTVSVDRGSRSSAALLRIVIELFLGVSPEYARRDPGNGFLDGVDAGMLIGDRGLRALHLGREGFPLAYDLGEIWTEETGLPFVYAVFAARKGARLGDVDRRHLPPGNPAAVLPAAPSTVLPRQWEGRLSRLPGISNCPQNRPPFPLAPNPYPGL